VLAHYRLAVTADKTALTTALRSSR
jgi:hypothetical protein